MRMKFSVPTSVSSGHRLRDQCAEAGVPLFMLQIAGLEANTGRPVCAAVSKEKPRRVRPGFFAQARAGIMQQLAM
jgi:hypothetical protein